jgi:hypothetical protein
MTRKSDVANLNLTLKELNILTMAINAQREKNYSTGSSIDDKSMLQLSDLQKRFLNLAARLRSRMEGQDDQTDQNVQTANA